MRKFWQSIICVALVMAAIFSSFACSSTPKTSQSSINLRQMANDVDNLKTSFSVLNTAFTNLKIGDSVSVSSFDTLKGDFLLLKAKVDLIETPKQEVTQAELDILAAQVSAISTSINSLTTQLTALDNELSVVQSDVASLKTSVAALQIVATTTAPTPTSLTSAVSVAIEPYGVSAISSGLSTEQKLYYIVKFTNTSNAAFNSVRFKVTFYTQISSPPQDKNDITLTTVGGTMPVSSIWLPSSTDNVYSFTSLQSVNIAAKAVGEIDLLLSITLTSPVAPSVTWPIYPQVVLVG